MLCNKQTNKQPQATIAIWREICLKNLIAIIIIIIIIII